MAVVLPLAALWVHRHVSVRRARAGRPVDEHQPSRPSTPPRTCSRASTTVPPTTIDPSSTTGPGRRRQLDSPAGDETRTVWLIVLALVVVALVLAFLTFRYWQRTRPARPQPFDQDRADDRADAERRPVG